MFVLDTILPIFGRTLLPVFLVALGGFLLSSRMEMDGRTVGRFLFFLATPSLVFRSLYQTDIDFGTLRQLALVAVTITVVSAVLGWLVSFDQNRRRRAAIILTSSISNNGNMGIPITGFAFGDMGVALGSLYYVVNSFLGNTAGVVVASAGQTPIGQALGASLRVPVLYAAALGLLLNWGQVQVIPAGIMRAVDLLANGAIPGMLVLLGIQLRQAPIRQRQAVILRSAAIRLVASPVLAWYLCRLMGILGPERNVLILQAAMPTAVMTAVLATEYDTAPRLVATVILATTLASAVTLSLVLWFLLG